MVNIRLTDLKDLTAVLAAEQHPENAPYVLQWSRTRHRQAIDNPDEVHWSVEVAGRWIGYVLLGGLQNPDKALNIRRVVIIEKGQGYGKQTLQHIQRYGFEHCQMHRLWLDVKSDNHRARALYRAVGFVEEGLLRDAMKTDAGFESLIVMSQLISEYTGFA